LDNTFTHYQNLIEKEISNISFGDKPIELYEPLKYMMRLGGKRFRPALVLMSNGLFGGREEVAIHPAIGMEVFHNFTLIHDDIMDNAPLRRGKPTVHEKWGQTIAILSGDVMLVKAYHFISMVRPEILPEVLQLFNETASRVCEGQQYDMNFEQKPSVSIDEYVEMIGLKTAALLAGCLKMGAIIANAPMEDADRIYDFGYLLGTAFQVQDDLLDAFGNADTFGKSIGGDIFANKKTWLTLKAKEIANAEDATELDILFASRVLPPEKKIARVMEIYRRTGVKELTEEARDSFYHQALESLDAINLPEENKQPLKGLAIELIERVK